MLSVKVGGTWLSSIAPYGPVTVEFGLHGSEAASWEMDTYETHPLLRGNQSVVVYDGGFPIWAGNLVEPGSDGLYSARGLWRQAENAPAITAAGAPTMVADTAILAANSRGDISWTYTGSISATAWAGSTEPTTLAQLLDGVAAELGTRWIVTPNYEIKMMADPVDPTWQVPYAVAGQGLTPAEDEFVTHLVGTYLVSTPPDTFSTETVGSAASAAVFGRRTRPVDLTPMGVITAARANAVLTGMFLQSGARMGWGESLSLSHGELVNTGGAPAALAQVQSLQMVRLMGTVDMSRANLIRASTDLVIATSRYTDGSATIDLTPLGYAPRTLSDVLEVAMEVSE